MITDSSANTTLQPPLDAAPLPGDEANIHYTAERLQLMAWFVAAAALLAIAASVLRANDFPPFYAVARWLMGGSAACLVFMIAGLIDAWGRRSFMWPRWTWRFLDLGVAGLAALLAAQWSYTASDPAVSLYVAGPLWMLAVAGALFAAWPRRETAAAQRERVEAWELFALTGILLLAVILRAANFHGLPETLVGDESIFVLQARAVNQGQLFRPFLTAEEGHWGLWYMALGAFTRLFGETLAALRLHGALIGTLSVLAAYALTRLLWGRRPALIAAALLAVYHLHLYFSRSALNNIDDALFFLTVFGFFWLGWRQQRRGPWLLGALTLGLAQYFCPSGRLILIACAVQGLFWLITDRARMKTQALNIALAMGVLAVTVTPIVYLARLQPDDYLAHFNQANILRNGWLSAAMRDQHTGAVQILWQQLLETLRLIGTGPAAVFYQGRSLLTPVMTALALISLLYLVWHLKDGRAFFLLSSLAVFIVLGGVLAVSPLAGADRLVGAMPLIYISVAVLIDRGWAEIERRWPARKRVVSILGIMLIAVLVIGDAYYYFGPAAGSVVSFNPQLAASLSSDADWEQP